MKKTGCRPRLKRASTAPKERWCGVPCTLLVAAWSLFILLLITSSISHRDDEQAARDYLYGTERPWTALFWASQTFSIRALFGREDSRLQGHAEHCSVDEWVEFRNDRKLMERSVADKSIFRHFAAYGESGFTPLHELTDVEDLLRRGDGYHPYGNVGDLEEDLISSSVTSSSSENDNEGHPSHFTTILGDETEQQQAPPVTRMTFQDLGQPIDALQYAEDGAGLHQRTGIAEESSKICFLRTPEGVGCHVISHHSELPSENCVWHPPASGPTEELKEVLLPAMEQERCHDVSSYGGAFVAEIKPGGESYLVCQSHPLFEKTTLCCVACSTDSVCLLQGLGLNPNDTPQIDDLVVEISHQEGAGGVLPPVSISERSISSGLPPSDEVEAVQPSEQIDEQQHDDELPPSSDPVTDSNSVSEQDVKETKESLEGNGDEIPTPNVDVEDVHNESAVVQEASSEKMTVNVEFLAPLVETDASGRESLVDPAEDGPREEERDLDDDLLAELVIEPSRLKRVGSVLSLDEYRSMLENQRKNGNQVNLSSVQAHRQKVRHSDESYNYASSTHGAKVLASNKEAKGAGHVLTSDKDKYLRNPCGTEDKFVVIELSEETFVDTVVVSNFEFHSSNLKDFEVLGSPVYPTKDWISLGKFQAENVRQRQKFTIEDPSLVRHIMIKMLSHWGSEFFCTLSVVEVFGVDVIKNLLDDWIALEEGENGPRTQENSGSSASQEESSTPNSNGQKSEENDVLDASFAQTLFTQAETRTGSDNQGSGAGGREYSTKTDGVHGDEDSQAGAAADLSAQDVVHLLGGKPPSESVLKILMQRVKSLELNQTLFDLYLGDMNQKYKAMLSELDKDLALVTERLRNQTLLTASLAMRLADRELQRKEEKLYMEHQFAQIASNFTDSLDFMRWQIQSMERREITAILLALVCMISSALLNLLASCLPRRHPAEHEFPAQPKTKEQVFPAQPKIKEQVFPAQPKIKEAVVDDSLGEVDHDLGESDNSLGEIDNSLGEVDNSLVDNPNVDGVDSNGDQVDNKLTGTDRMLTDSKSGGIDSKSGAVDDKLDSFSLSAACHRSSSFILYLACGLTILVLSV